MSPHSLESDLFAVHVPFKQWFTAEATGLLMAVKAGTLVGLFSQQTDPQATERSFHLVWEVRAYIDVYLPYLASDPAGQRYYLFPNVQSSLFNRTCLNLRGFIN